MLRPGDSSTVDYPYSPHRGHTVTLVEIDGGNTAHWSCSCGEGWSNAWDPGGDLGSEDPPEG